MDGAPQMSYVFLFSPRKPSRLDWSCLFKACQVHGGVYAPWINLNMAAIVRWMEVESQYFIFCFAGGRREPLSRRINEHKAAVNRPDEWRPERWAGSHFNSLWNKCPLTTHLKAPCGGVLLHTYLRWFSVSHRHAFSVSSRSHTFVDRTFTSS